MATLVLGPLMAALGVLLRADATLIALVPAARISDDIAQATAFPFVWVEVKERDTRGFGTGTLPEVEVRIHVFSQHAGMKEAHAIMDRIIVLLKDQPISVAGFNHCGGSIFHDNTVPLPNEELNGVKVRELVGMFRAYFEKAA